MFTYQCPDARPFVSPHFPDDFSKQTFGVFKRLDLLVSAISGMVQS
jgi:hypothetical protein